MSDGLLTPPSHESNSKSEQHATDTHLERPITDGVDLPRKSAETKPGIGSGLPQALQLIEDGLELLRKHSPENINRRIELILDLVAEVNQTDVAE